VPMILRKIDKPNWYLPDGWECGDAPGDVLRDLCPKGGRLSVWIVEDDASNLGRLLAALGSTRGNIDHIDYVLFSFDVLRQTDIVDEKADGGSHDSGANARWHHDLIDLSVTRVAALAAALAALGDKSRVRCSYREVAEHLAAAVDEGCIQLEKLNPAVRAKLASITGERGL